MASLLGTEVDREAGVLTDPDGKHKRYIDLVRAHREVVSATPRIMYMYAFALQLQEWY